MNPVSIRIFDVNNSSRTVTNRLYDLSLTEGVDGAKVPKDGLQWESCVLLSVDNTSVTVGNPNSIPSWFIQKTSDVFICG